MNTPPPKTMVIQAGYLVYPNHQVPVQVVDCRPTARTIVLSHPSEEDYNVGETYAFVRLPFHRFVLGYQPMKDHYRWDSRLHLLGSIRPFVPGQVGFALPLPNLDLQGGLTCPGSMASRPRGTPQEVAIQTVQTFWGTGFYSVFDQHFPRTGGKRPLRSMKQVLKQGLDVYRHLPEVAGFEIQLNSGV